MPKSGDGYYEGQLLVATPQIQQGIFAKSLVYLLEHNEEGAMGIVVNRVLEKATNHDVMRQLGIDTDTIQFDTPIYLGGPVDVNRGFILHSTDYSGKASIMVGRGLMHSQDMETLKAVITGDGPEKVVLALGYSGWGAGQLEKEISEMNSWFTVPASEELIFSTDNANKWIMACRSVGVDPYKLSDVAGHA